MFNSKKLFFVWNFDDFISCVINSYVFVCFKEFVIGK